jgi:DNA-binding transcriptional regulator YhcF (GntR family)
LSPLSFEILEELAGILEKTECWVPYIGNGTIAVTLKGTPMSKKDPLHETKKNLTIFCTNSHSPLTYSELLVFCFRADQHRYQSLPSIRRVAKGTGLKETTVSGATDRLVQLGLLAADGTVVTPCPHLDWFVINDSLRARYPDGPEFSWLQNWKSLIRQPGGDNLLTVPSVLIYSVIRHAIHHKWKPSGGWTQEYLAQLTRTNSKTVAKSLTILEEKGFLSVLDGMRFRLYALRDSQLSCFADKGTWSGNSSEPDELVDTFSPASAEAEKRYQRVQELADHLAQKPISDLAKREFLKVIINSPHPVSTWREHADYLADELLKLDLAP